jgi:iron complex outermembrane recepter protein
MHSLRKLKAALCALLGLAAAFSLPAQTTTTTTTTAPTPEQPASPGPEATEEPQILAKFVVTGSNIPTAVDAMAVPVTVISQEQMQDSGVDTNILDILRKVSPAITGMGGENATTTSNDTLGGASVSIHNLATLVLIDGHREAYDPVDAAGGVEFVDLNQLPLAAIDHIEILSDGASAIYGADAVGGVINIILKKDYNGSQMDVHYGFSDTTGHYSERSGDMVAGVSNGTTSITASVSYTQTDPIFESERPYSNPFYATTYFPGIIEDYNFAGIETTGIGDEFYQLAPGLNAPPGGGTYTIQQLVAMGIYKDLGDASTPGVLNSVEDQFNLAAKENLAQAFKREGFSVDVDHKIFGDSLVSFADAIYTHTYTQTFLNAQPLFPYVSTPSGNSDIFFYGVTPPASTTEYVPYTAPSNPFNAAVLDDGYSDGTGGSGILVHNRFIPYPRIFQDDDQTLHIVGGLKGKISEDWGWEVSANINAYDLHYTNINVLDTANLVAAFADGQLNPFAITQAPGALSGVLGTAFVDYTSTLNEFDAKVNGALFELPAGKILFALGADISRQNLSASPDANTADGGWDDSPTVLPFNRNRTIDSVYAEIEIPVVDKGHPLPGVYSLNLDAAGRYDNYTTIGGHSVPKVDLKYQPFNDQFTFRAAAGNSFIVPTLFDLYGPTTHGSSDLISYTTAGGTSIQNVQFQAAGGSNPALKPSTATNWSAGFVFSPKAVDGLSLTFDYYQTVQKGIFGTVAEQTVIQSVEDLGSASPYAGLIHFGSQTGPSPTTTTPGQISTRPLSNIYIVTPLINLGSQAVKGFDASLVYVLPNRTYGKFEFTSTLSAYSSYLLQVLPSEDYYQYAGHLALNQQSVSGEGGTIPRWRTYTTIEWRKSGFDALVAHSFVPTVTSIGPGGSGSTPPIGVDSYSEFDLSLSYNLGALHRGKWLDGLLVRVGVNDVFNEYPPLAPSGQENANVDLSTYNGAVGRMLYTDVSYKF